VRPGAQYRLGLYLTALGCLGAIPGGVLLAAGARWFGVLVLAVALIVALVGDFLRVQAFKRYLNR
jgi:hypothetical protein